MRDKSYQYTPLGMAAAGYLRQKRKQLTAGSERKYESALHKLSLYYADLEPADFEPPVGTERLEEFMHAQWGDLAPRTYNANLAAIRGFFKWLHAQGHLHGDPALAIGKTPVGDPYRETFTRDQVNAIIASAGELRDRIGLRLMLKYALRKSEVRACQFKHFNHAQRRLTVFGKGGTVVPIPIPDAAFWHDLERLILDTAAEPDHYLICGRRGNRHGSRLLPKTRISNHGMHDWWYARLHAAGITAAGQTKGQKMHMARDTAGQTVLDNGGNLVAVKRLLRHKRIATTADTYLDWDLEQLTSTLAAIYGDAPDTIESR
jgi:integrase/recombinase XerD